MKWMKINKKKVKKCKVENVYDEEGRKKDEE